MHEGSTRATHVPAGRRLLVSPSCRNGPSLPENGSVPNAVAATVPLSGTVGGSQPFIPKPVVLFRACSATCFPSNPPPACPWSFSEFQPHYGNGVRHAWLRRFAWQSERKESPTFEYRAMSRPPLQFDLYPGTQDDAGTLEVSPERTPRANPGAWGTRPATRRA